MNLTIRKSYWIDDWFVIERTEHEGRIYYTCVGAHVREILSHIDTLDEELADLTAELDNTRRELAHARTPDGVKTALLELDKDPNVGGPIGAVTKSWRQLYDKAADCVVELRQASSERDDLRVKLTKADENLSALSKRHDAQVQVATEERAELRGKLTASEREVAALKQLLTAIDGLVRELLKGAGK